MIYFLLSNSNACLVIANRTRVKKNFDTAVTLSFYGKQQQQQQRQHQYYTLYNVKYQTWIQGLKIRSANVPSAPQVHASAVLLLMTSGNYKSTMLGCPSIFIASWVKKHEMGASRLDDSTVTSQADFCSPVPPWILMCVALCAMWFLTACFSTATEPRIRRVTNQNIIMRYWNACHSVSISCSLLNAPLHYL